MLGSLAAVMLDAKAVASLRPMCPARGKRCRPAPPRLRVTYVAPIKVAAGAVDYDKIGAIRYRGQATRCRSPPVPARWLRAHRGDQCH
jgi:hypothetical protein